MLRLGVVVLVLVGAGRVWAEDPQRDYERHLYQERAWEQQHQEHLDRQYQQQEERRWGDLESNGSGGMGLGDGRSPNAFGAEGRSGGGGEGE